MLKLLSLFIIVPLIELALLLVLADWTSWQWTLALVVVTGLTGAWLAKSQGWHTLRRIREDLTAGRLPAEPLLDTLLIFAAGALLLTPGVLTDLLAISMLVPWSRTFYRRRLVAWAKSHLTIRTSGNWPTATPRSEVIDSYVIGPTKDERERLDATKLE